MTRAVRLLVVLMLGLGAALVAAPGPAWAEPAPQPTPTQTAKPTGKPDIGVPGVLQNPAQLQREQKAKEEADTANRALSNPGKDCKRPPMPAPRNNGLAGFIDPGPQRPTGSTYSTLGWAGLGLVMYDPGCAGAGVDTTVRRIVDGPNLIASFLLWCAVALCAFVVTLVRAVTAPGGVLAQLLTPVTDAIGVQVAPVVFVVLFPLLSLLSVVFLVAGARKQGRLAVTARRSGGILALCLAAVACLAWSGYAASATDATTGKLFPAVGEVIAGGDPVDVAVGDLLTDGIVEPLWTMAQVGDMSPEAVAVGRRLRAASVYVAGEDTGTATTGTKIGHYRQTAAEWQTANPAAYQEGLAGTNTGRRVEWTSVAFLGAILAAGPLLVALVVWVVFATLLELAPRVLPIAAAFLQFPGWQRHAAAAGRFLGKWSMLGVGGIVVCIVWTAIVSGVLAQTGTPIMARIGSLLLLVAVPLVCWRFRALALKRLGISKEAKHGRRGLDWAADRTPYLGARRRARREADAEETDDGPSRAGRTGGDVPEAVAEVERAPEPTDSEWEYAAFEATRRERDETRRDQWVSADDTEPEDFDLDDVYEATAATNPAVLKLETAEADELARRAATRAPAKAGAVMPEPSPDREPVLAGSHKVVK